MVPVAAEFARVRHDSDVSFSGFGLRGVSHYGSMGARFYAPCQLVFFSFLNQSGTLD